MEPTTIVRFRIKPLCDVSQAQVMFWSEKRKDNYRQNVTSLKKGEWKEVEFKAIEARIGWARDGPTMDVLTSFHINFQGPADARMVLDDFKIRD